MQSQYLIHGQFFTMKLLSQNETGKKVNFAWVVKSHLLYAFLKNQACFQTYPTISDFYRFCETGVKYGETGCETGVKLWFAISQ